MGRLSSRIKLSHWGDFLARWWVLRCNWNLWGSTKAVTAWWGYTTGDNAGGHTHADTHSDFRFIFKKAHRDGFRQTKEKGEMRTDILLSSAVLFLRGILEKYSVCLNRGWLWVRATGVVSVSGSSNVFVLGHSGQQVTYGAYHKKQDLQLDPCKHHSSFLTFSSTAFLSFPLCCLAPCKNQNTHLYPNT